MSLSSAPIVNLKCAIAFAILDGQSQFNCIPLPKPRTNGTTIQKKIDAYLKADFILWIMSG